MTKLRLSRLQRVVQKLGLEQVIPHLSEASDAELQAPFAKFLALAEYHRSLGISENFDPTTLPSVSFTEVKYAAIGARAHDDIRSSLMKPYCATMTMEEIMSLLSQGSKIVSLTKPPLDSDDFLACRMFFRMIAEAVEQGFRIVILNDKEHTLAVIVHIKALRMLKVVPSTVERGLLETVILQTLETILLQVEYGYMSVEDTHSRENYDKIVEDLTQQYPADKTRIVLGTSNQIYFVHQVLQAHEFLLETGVISKHDKEWIPRQKYIRPSFIVPLRTILLDECPRNTQELLEEIKGTVVSASKRTTNNAVESNNGGSCAVCGKTNVELKVCSVCKSIKYCTRECQASDWRSHKQTCRAMGSDL